MFRIAIVILLASVSESVVAANLVGNFIERSCSHQVPVATEYLVVDGTYYAFDASIDSTKPESRLRRNLIEWMEEGCTYRLQDPVVEAAVHQCDGYKESYVITSFMFASKLCN